METIAVIDTETTWDNRVMSIGAVIAEKRSFTPLDTRYYVLTPEFEIGGMFSNALFCDADQCPRICSRQEALCALISWLQNAGVSRVFAYNAGFDKGHLPEMHRFHWYDIMRLAAYRQFNPHIPADADCYATGRMKRGFGVEAMLRLLSGDCSYREIHNALTDALDELTLMRLLGHPVETYIEL